MKETSKVDGKEAVTEKELDICNVDVHHFFAETISKGKKSNHTVYNTALDTIINLYKTNGKLSVPLKHVIVWTDNAPMQYIYR